MPRAAQIARVACYCAERGTTDSGDRSLTAAATLGVLNAGARRRRRVRRHGIREAQRRLPEVEEDRLRDRHARHREEGADDAEGKCSPTSSEKTTSTG